MKFYVIIMAVSGLASALPRRNAESAREISDIHKIVAHLPASIREELHKSSVENPGEKLFEYMNNGDVGRREYIVGGKGKQRYRVKLKKKTPAKVAANNTNIVHDVTDSNQIEVSKNSNTKGNKSETSNNHSLVNDSNKGETKSVKSNNYRFADDSIKEETKSETSNNSKFADDSIKEESKTDTNNYKLTDDSKKGGIKRETSNNYKYAGPGDSNKEDTESKTFNNFKFIADSKKEDTKSKTSDNYRFTDDSIKGDIKSKASNNYRFADDSIKEDTKSETSNNYRFADDSKKGDIKSKVSNNYRFADDSIEEGTKSETSNNYIYAGPGVSNKEDTKIKTPNNDIFAGVSNDKDTKREPSNNSYRYDGDFNTEDTKSESIHDRFADISKEEEQSQNSNNYANDSEQLDEPIKYIDLHEIEQPRISTVRKPVEKLDVSDVVQNMSHYFHVTSEDIRLFAKTNLGFDINTPQNLLKLELIYKDFLSHAKNYDDADTISYFKGWLRNSKYWKEPLTPHFSYDSHHSRDDFQKANVKVINIPVGNTKISSEWLAEDPTYKIIKYRPNYVVEKEIYQPENVFHKLKTDYQDYVTEFKNYHHHKGNSKTYDEWLKSKHDDELDINYGIDHETNDRRIQRPEYLTKIITGGQSLTHLNSGSLNKIGFVMKDKSDQSRKSKLNFQINEYDNPLLLSKETRFTADDKFHQMAPTLQAHDQSKVFVNKVLNSNKFSGLLTTEIKEDNNRKQNLNIVNHEKHALKQFQGDHSKHKQKLVSSYPTGTAITSSKRVEDNQYIPGYFVEKHINKPVNLYKLRTDNLYKLRTDYQNYVLALKSMPNYGGKIKTFENWLESTHNDDQTLNKSQNEKEYKDNDFLYSAEITSDGDNYQSAGKHVETNNVINTEPHFNNNKQIMEDIHNSNYNQIKSTHPANVLLDESIKDIPVEETLVETKYQEDHENLKPNQILQERKEVPSLKEWLDFNSKHFNDVKQPITSTSEISAMLKHNQDDNTSQGDREEIETVEHKINDQNILQSKGQNQQNVQSETLHLLKEPIPLLSADRTMLKNNIEISLNHKIHPEENYSEMVKGIKSETGINDHYENSHLLHGLIPSLSEHNPVFTYSKYNDLNHRIILQDNELKNVKGVQDETETNDHERHTFTILQPKGQTQLKHFAHELIPSSPSADKIMKYNLGNSLNHKINSQENYSERINGLKDESGMNDDYETSDLLHESIPALSENSPVLSHSKNNNLNHKITSQENELKNIKGAQDETETIDDHKQHIFTILQPEGQSQLNSHSAHGSIPSSPAENYSDMIKGIKDETGINDDDENSDLLHESTNPALSENNPILNRDEDNNLNVRIPSQEKGDRLFDETEVNDYEVHPFIIMQPEDQSQLIVQSQPSNDIVIENEPQIFPTPKENGVDIEQVRANKVNNAHQNEYPFVTVDKSTPKKIFDRIGNYQNLNYVSCQPVFRPCAQTLEVDSAILQQETSTKKFKHHLKLLVTSIARLYPYKSQREIYRELLSILFKIFPNLRYMIQNEINLKEYYYGLNPTLYDESIADAQLKEIEGIYSSEMVPEIQIPRPYKIEGLPMSEQRPNGMTLEQFLNSFNGNSNFENTFASQFIQNKQFKENDLMSKYFLLMPSSKLLDGEFDNTLWQKYPLVDKVTFKDKNMQTYQNYPSSVPNLAATLLDIPKPNYDYYYRLMATDILKQTIRRIVYYLIKVNVPIANIRYLVNRIYLEMVEYIQHHVVTFDCPCYDVNGFIEILRWKIKQYILEPSNRDRTK